MSTPHTYVKHDKGCTIQHCNICEGGLSVCSKCGNAEGTLPTHCPEVQCYATLGDLIYRGFIDYKNGQWQERRRGNTHVEDLNTPDATIVEKPCLGCEVDFVGKASREICYSCQYHLVRPEYETLLWKHELRQARAANRRPRSSHYMLERDGNTGKYIEPAVQFGWTIFNEALRK